MSEKLKLQIVKGSEDNSIYLNDYRIAGPKPWGNGKVLKEYTINKKDIETAIEILPPKYETPKQYKERTGKDYPGNGPVWYIDTAAEDWEIQTLIPANILKIMFGDRVNIIIATPEHGKPDPDWRPNE